MTILTAVTVVVPCRNSAATLGGQLRALSEQTYPGPLQILVSDNGSTDATRAVVARAAPRFARHGGVQILDASQRRGVAAARNAAVKAATGDVVLFCDADDQVTPTWVEQMAAALNRADIVGGQLRLDLINSRRVRRWRTDPPMTRLPRALGFLPYAVGANLGVRTAVYRTLDGCDERYQGHEDVEFCWRAQLAGHTVAYAPEAVIHYQLRSTLRGLAAQRFRSGRTYAQLFAQYRHLGIAPNRWHQEVRVWVRLLANMPALVRPETAGTWVFGAAWHVGRLRGSVSARALCPQ